MAILVEISKITNRIQVRNLKASGIERLKDKINKLGFLPQHPVLLAQHGLDEYELLDGNHRFEAAIALGHNIVPAHIISNDLNDSEKKKLARQANEASETVVPTTFVDDAEFIWREAEQGKTLDEIKGMLGWGLDKVKKYSALKPIDPKVWALIVPTFEEVRTSDEETVGTQKVPTGTFTEGLLREIIELTSEQQLELVNDLLTKEGFTKGKFKKQAENYLARNAMKVYAIEKLGDLGEEFTSQLLKEIYSGAYDADWKNETHPKLEKLIATIREEWEEKNSIHLIHGDFYEQVKTIGNASIDLMLTDPPYNVANDREFILEGRTNISQDFGEWDKYEHQAFIDLFQIWGSEWHRILKEHGSGYVFTSDSYISHLREALERSGLTVKATIVWHKKNPGTQVVKTNFKSSLEYIIFFTKGEGGHTFNWLSDEGSVMHNFIDAAICGGKERIVDAKGDTRHPTQKPEEVIEHFMKISSNRGDTVFDGFMGVGTTAKIAKNLGRKFIGIEQDEQFFDAARRRVE